MQLVAEGLDDFLEGLRHFVADLLLVGKLALEVVVAHVAPGGGDVGLAGDLEEGEEILVGHALVRAALVAGAVGEPAVDAGLDDGVGVAAEGDGALVLLEVVEEVAEVGGERLDPPHLGCLGVEGAPVDGLPLFDMSMR